MFGRRKFIFSLGALGLASGSNAQQAVGSRTHEVPIDPSKAPGLQANYDSGYGLRSQFAKGHRISSARTSLSPLQSMYGTVTPSGLHYGLHHGGIPTIDPAKHKLVIHGMVQRDLEFSIEDILRYPRVTRMLFLECAGNTASQWRGPRGNSVQMTHGLVSNSEWTGVPLRYLLRDVGVNAEAKWVIAEGNDAGAMSRSLPLAKCLDDAIIAFGQNGEELRPEQGFPIRLLMPGFEGNTNVKWLSRLELTDRPFMTRFETRAYTDLLPSGKARQFSFEMEAKSVITSPSAGMNLPNSGYFEITGLAWSGRGRIARVQVSSDGGETWQDSKIDGPALPQAFVRFRQDWHWDGKPAILQSRCVDETGYVQPTIDQLRQARGLRSIDHMNGIQSWGINSFGEIENVQV